VAGATLIVLGPEPRSLAGSRWAWDKGHRGGEAPTLDLPAHAAVAALVRRLVTSGLVAGAHDAADGLGVALAEMAVCSGLGFDVSVGGADATWVFAESASRVVVCVLPEHLSAVLAAATEADVPATEIGAVATDRLRIDPFVDVALEDAVAAWRGRIRRALGSGTVH
jgi:phosphoribosylformylglycinamidine (FGAM) synthase-like enzyme